MSEHHYFVYITTNPTRTAVYTGMTNDLVARLQEHYENRGNPETFAGKYHCYHLVHWEHHPYVRNAIAREKEIKGWRRKKKNALIAEYNPEWRFLNAEIQH
ncbi:MAG: GIY-YIG nuclease family protein [Cytophagaceae bacterium]|nr:GIY-YIG nuclease family protein [Cytophagaceae bacterium]